MEKNLKKKGFPGGSVVKNPPANVGDVGLIPDCMWEDSTYRGVAKPRRHNSGACAQEPGELQRLKPMSPRAHALQQESSQP